MTETKKCPNCRAELPADAPAGMCPKCLLAAGLASDTAIRGEPSEGEPTAPLPRSSRFVPPEPQELARLFPQLEILELIGAGGMGAVYKARQPGLDRIVAIKILPPEVGAGPAFAQRFTREAQALARLGHQHIVTVHDFGVAGELYYFIMEYVDGANLRHLIKSGGLKPAEALAIVPQICEALQFAHDEGVVHRDIKPENILIDKRGRVKIADFGLARLLGTAAPELVLTGTHQVLGTLHYMAPEQLQGLRTVDHRADIYSLGVVFYEMLTGELPLGRFSPPSHKVEVDVRLDEVVLRSLETEPQRRYQQASDVKTDVEQISQDSAAQLVGRGHDVRSTDSHIGSDAARGFDQDDDERQRAAELADRPPYWLDFGAMGLFGLGWIFTGLMWNLRWPGLAIAVMAAITYGVVRWKVVYVPKLRAELLRQSHFRRGIALSVSLLLFVSAIFLLIAAQTIAWDSLHTSVFRTFNFEEKEQAVRSAVRFAELEGLRKDAVVSPGGWGGSASITLPWFTCLLNGVWGFLFLFGSVSTVIDTQRFRGTWKYLWAPSLSISFACFVTLPAVQAARAVVMGHSSGTVSPREIRCAARSEQVEAVIDRWTKSMGYADRGHYYIEIVEQQKTVGKIRVVELWQESHFDRYQLSWRNGVYCPRPAALSIACVTTDDPAQAYVRVDLPMQNMGSPEETMWPKLLDDLEAAIRAAAESKKG